ncbi:hypothetical protein GCM10009753_00130 [Streptantibioticus ferralitis]
MLDKTEHMVERTILQRQHDHMVDDCHDSSSRRVLPATASAAVLTASTGPPRPGAWPWTRAIAWGHVPGDRQGAAPDRTRAMITMHAAGDPAHPVRSIRGAPAAAGTWEGNETDG